MTKDQLKIVFLGTPDFAVESLRRIHEGGYNVVGVVTMPDKPAGRGKHLSQSAVKQYAVAHGLNLLQPEKLKDEAFVSELRALDADLFIVIAFRMLPEVVWRMPRLGTFNLHASLLPRYRGAAPINRAVMNGDSETGVTTFFLKHELDTGDVIAQERISIGPDENVGSVHDRLMLLGTDLTINTIDHIIAGDLKPVPQSELSQEEPTPAPKIFKEDCRIDWSRPARELHNHVRGLSPYPAAWCELYAGNEPQGAMKVYATKVVDEDQEHSAPGAAKVDRAAGTITVDCGRGALMLTEVQAPGKKRMPVADWLRGCRFDEINFK